MSTAGQPIIVVKKRGGHGGHHGGAWKVAYADFVTAMMAFFLVMWLVTQSKAVKAAIGGYFRDPTVFEATYGKGVLPGGTSVDVPVAKPAADDGRKRLEEAAQRIRQRIDQVPAFKNLGKQVEFTITPDGLRIDLVEKDDSTFFDSGSASLRGEAEHILGVIAKEIGDVDHEVAVEGHTDSHSYAANDRYSNWELSADRANAARRVMERQGLRPSQLTSVRGLADRQLRVPSDPFDPRNRRVSILVKNTSPAAPAAKPDPAAPSEPVPGAAAPAPPPSPAAAAAAPPAAH